MAKKLSELFLQKKTFIPNGSTIGVISVLDAKTYSELVLDEWHSEVGELDEDDEEWMNELAEENGITDYEI